MPISQPEPTAEDRARGERAESVAAWYLRVNGFMAIPGFVVHLDQVTPRVTRTGQQAIARTEADFVAVRFLFSREIVADKTMQDDPLLVKDLDVSGKKRPLFALAEVKASDCRMNGPWTNRSAGNMQRVIRRMGFTDSERVVEMAADALYDRARWEGNKVVLQYFCFGSRKSDDIQQQHMDLTQITWSEIGRFLHRRHSSHPEKTPGGLVHEQWPMFGRAFGDWFVSGGRERGLDSASRAVEDYVRSGSCRGGA